ncbi:SHOCT domain-containing protein [Actinospica acidithermotolerans]
MMYWYGDGHPGAWGYTAMIIGMLLFWAVIVGVGILIARALAGPRTAHNPGAGAGPTALPAPRRNPEQILAERFAAGEIDEHEYATRLAVLRDRHPSS